jgi:mono/diheme cytochrome c family protein
MQRLEQSNRPSFWVTLGLSVLVAAIAVSVFGAAADTKGADSDKADKKADKKAAKADAKAAEKAMAAAGPLPDKNLSFSKNIAPLLVTKCGNCHVRAAKGKFSMATFADLKKGTPDGVVISPGKSSGSRLIDVIESGDMPRGGAKVTKPELAALAKWIDEGAKFDGKDEKATLTSLVGAAGGNFVSSKADEPKLKVVMATGKETVKFSRDIAPMLVENCMSCHGGQNPAQQLQMDRFVDFVRGGQSGNPWVPDKPEDSLLIKKIKGLAGKRMPLNKPALSAEEIAKFEKWVAEGARFDGDAPNQPTRMLAALTHAKSATHDELSADRMTTGRRLWLLANPNNKPVVVQTKNLIVISGLPEDAANEMAETAESQAEVVAKQLHALPANQPLVKGRIVLFIMPNRYSYSEFGKMVENRQLPAEWRGNWKYDVVDAYGVALQPTESNDYSFPALMAQEIASVYVASLPGAPPQWFSEGSGRVLAGRLDARSARVRNWGDRLHELAPAGKMDTFINKGLPLEDNDVAAYGFVKELAANGSKYTSLLAALRKGEEFDRAFPSVFGPLPALAAGWAKNAH